MSDYGYHLKWNSHSSNLVAVLDTYMKNEKLTDVTLVAAEGKQIHVHSFVLIASSTYFRVT
jgi:hypothetical protein